MSEFVLEVLPASDGDCLLLSYGETKERLSHVLIDGGRVGTWKYLKPILSRIADLEQSLELLVLTHIDADHISGLNQMLNGECPITPDAVWHNGYEQLNSLGEPELEGTLGFKGADAYSNWLNAKGWAVNEHVGGRPVCIEECEVTETPGGLKLTLLSPDHFKLRKLKSDWDRWRDGQDDPTHAGKHQDEGALGGAGIGEQPRVPVTLEVEKLALPSKSDPSVTNGTSIAMIAEYAGRRVLLAADAHADLLEKRISEKMGDNGKYKIDLFKLPHHGSKANLTDKLLRMIDCSRFVVSTNGTRFQHPDPEAIARVLKFSPKKRKQLFFNYASEYTRPWDDSVLRIEWNYECIFPVRPEGGLTVEV